MKHLLTLILLLSFFSCDKEKDAPQPLSARSEKEIFNAVVGTWHFSRLAHDANFKNIQEVPYHECTEKYYLNFKKDSTMSAVRGCVEGDIERGFFCIRIGNSNLPNDTRPRVDLSIGVWFSPNISRGGAILHHYTDSTLIFSEIGHEDINGKYIPNLYSEFKRVK